MLVKVPRGWTLGRLGQVLDPIRRGHAPAPDRSYRLVGVRLYGNGIRYQGNFAGATLKSSKIYELKSGDIIYNKMWASKGTFAIVPALSDTLFATSEYPTFRTNGANPEFLRYVFSQPRFWDVANNWSTGTTDRARLSPKDFGLLPLALPNLDEQTAIADVLSSVETQAIHVKNLIESLNEAKRNRMLPLLTTGIYKNVKFRSIPRKWTLGRVAENVTQIPATWSLVRLTSVAKLESGHTPSRNKPEYWFNGDIPWISLTDTKSLNGLEITETAEMVSQNGIDGSSARLLPVGTVIFSRTATVGKSAIMGRPMSTSQDFANWVCGEKLHNGYLVQVFRHMQREWQRLKAGSTHQTIYMPTFKKLQILLPPLEEQIKIAEIGKAFDLRIEAETAYLTELKKTKLALAQELLSGRVRLPQSMIDRFKEPEEISESAA